MKKVVLVAFIFLCVSCQREVQQSDLIKLNGYWEIEQVTKADGEKKEYKVNETIDFFEVKENSGFRQKVMPQFDGTFRTNTIKESIRIIDSNAVFYIEYQTDYGKWREQIVEIQDSTMVLLNQENLEYSYKRFKPFSLK